MKSKWLSVGKIIICITVFLNLAFIFVQAALPPSVTGSEIDAVGGALGNVVSEKSDFGAFLQRNVSNIAHFCEYGALGFQIAVAIFLWLPKKLTCALVSLLVPLVLGFFDETVQIFSGRHSSVADIWIDVFGYAVFSALTLAVLLGVSAFRKKQKQRMDKNGKNIRG